MIETEQTLDQTVCHLSSSREIPYEEIRRAMFGQPFTCINMSYQEGERILRVVNQGIDARLEACYIPDRGDWYAAGGLAFVISPESFPVFLRRLVEIEVEETEDAEILSTLYLDVLGFRENGRWFPTSSVTMQYENMIFEVDPEMSSAVCTRIINPYEQQQERVGTPRFSGSSPVTENRAEQLGEWFYDILLKHEDPLSLLV